MIEKRYTFTKTDDKIIERIVSDDFADINHIVLNSGDALPEHFSNSNVYLIVVHGNLTLRLNDEEKQNYPIGSIVNIPINIKMNVSNHNAEVLEFFIVKAPGTKNLIK